MKRLAFPVKACELKGDRAFITRTMMLDHEKDIQNDPLHPGLVTPFSYYSLSYRIWRIKTEYAATRLIMLLQKRHLLRCYKKLTGSCNLANQQRMRTMGRS